MVSAGAVVWFVAGGNEIASGQNRKFRTTGLPGFCCPVTVSAKQETFAGRIKKFPEILRVSGVSLAGTIRWP